MPYRWVAAYALIHIAYAFPNQVDSLISIRNNWCFVIITNFPVFNVTQYLGKNMSEKAIEEMWEQTARGCKYN